MKSCLFKETQSFKKLEIKKSLIGINAFCKKILQNFLKCFLKKKLPAHVCQTKCRAGRRAHRMRMRREARGGRGGGRLHDKGECQRREKKRREGSFPPLATNQPWSTLDIFFLRIGTQHSWLLFVFKCIYSFILFRTPYPSRPSSPPSRARASRC